MNFKLTVRDIVRFIDQLNKDERYHYINPSTPTAVVIHSVTQPEGPIYIKRWRPSKGEKFEDAKLQSISVEMLARIAKAFIPNHPLNFDRVLGASYNTRSALETLMAHTPEFYFCYPGRIDSYTGKVERGHKHLIWCPDEPHAAGVIQEKETDVAISEMTFEATYDSLVVPTHLVSQGIDIEVARQHARIQIALILIGQQLGYRSWIAKNDWGIVYNGKTLVEMEAVLERLDKGVLISSMRDAVQAAQLIDCVWFEGSRYMHAVMEIEHSTGVVSGLARMQGLEETIPAIRTRYVIVAPDDLRENVIEKINRSQFKALDARYFPYSAVEELYQLCQRRRIRGVSGDFLDAFIEKVT